MTLRERAAAWLADDPDPETRAAVEAALDDPTRLADWFGSRLAFGTAGLRGALGPGPNRMNRLLVRRVTAALAAAVEGPGPIVVGYDGRRGSKIFAEDAAAVLLAAGREVFRYDRVCPTPELAHAVLALGAAAGVMVTASHNPPGDNGYKVYARNGAQIVPPLDAAIEEAVEALAPGPVPLADPGGAKLVPPEIRARYLREVLALRVHPGGAAPRVVYTAMHGVGRELLTELFTAAGRASGLVSVPEQADPDEAFPTVRFPNPEEPGALDLATRLATAVDADVVIANDPDADRLAVAVPEGAGWRVLTGDQVGCLLAEDLLAHGSGERPRLVATTIVSSRLLARIAKHHRVAYTETLTGFKWIANAALDFDGDFVLGYEEALGYTAGSVVRDKDGISAALLLVDLVAWLAGRGETLLDALARLYRRHGLFSGGQIAATSSAERIDRLLRALRAHPPEVVAGVRVRAVRDLAHGAVAGLPRADVLAFELEDATSILVRPSGTEPKIKVYYELCEPWLPDEPLGAAQARVSARASALRADLVTFLAIR